MCLHCESEWYGKDKTSKWNMLISSQPIGFIGSNKSDNDMEQIGQAALQLEWAAHPCIYAEPFLYSALMHLEATCASCTAAKSCNAFYSLCPIHKHWHEKNGVLLMLQACLLKEGFPSHGYSTPVLWYSFSCVYLYSVMGVLESLSI